MADRRGGDQRVEQAQTVGEVQPGKLFQCRLAFCLGRPHDLESFDERKGLVHFFGVAGILHEFHHHEARHPDIAFRCKPISGHAEASLDIDQYVGVDEFHGLNLQSVARCWAASRSRRQWTSGSVISAR